MMENRSTLILFLLKTNYLELNIMQSLLSSQIEMINTFAKVNKISKAKTGKKGRRPFILKAVE